MKARTSTSTLPVQYKIATQAYFKEYTGILTERTLYSIALALHDRGHSEKYIVGFLSDFYEIYEGYNELADTEFEANPDKPISEINEQMRAEMLERGVEIRIVGDKMYLKVQPRKRK